MADDEQKPESEEQKPSESEAENKQEENKKEDETPSIVTQPPQETTPPEDTPQEETEEEPYQKNPLLVLLVSLNTIFVIFLLFKQMGLGVLQESQIEEDLSQNDGYFFSPHGSLQARPEHTIDDLVFKEMDANFLSKGGPRRFLKISFIFAVDTPIDAPLDEINNLKPTIVDAIYSLINKTPARDVLKREGKEAFKSQLIAKVNQFLSKDKVVKVYYTKFIVK